MANGRMKNFRGLRTSTSAELGKVYSTAARSDANVSRRATLPAHAGRAVGRRKSRDPRPGLSHGPARRAPASADPARRWSLGRFHRQAYTGETARAEGPRVV